MKPRDKEGFGYHPYSVEFEEFCEAVDEAFAGVEGK